MMALRMGGDAPHLGMVVTEGSIGGYSVEPVSYTHLASPISNYLQEHYKEIHSLEELTTYFRVSKSYLCRIFRKQTGLTIVAVSYTHLDVYKRQVLCFGRIESVDPYYQSGKRKIES